MKLVKGKMVVTGNPSIAWVNQMVKMGMIFTHKDGIVYAGFEGSTIC